MGDHRPCFLDFNADLLFSMDTHPFAPPCQRSLQLSDPRRVHKYRELLHDQLQDHKVYDKCRALAEVASNKTWNDTHTLQYKNLDAIITQSMLFAESSCGKCYTKRFEWSPAMIKLVESVRYWRLLFKRSKGLQIQHSTICRAQTAAGLSHNTETVDQPTIIAHLRTALIAMRQAQKHHVELHESYLNGLAEAINLEKNHIYQRKRTRTPFII
jgi:hypothetical protein